jgi:hypothetical protein
MTQCLDEALEVSFDAVLHSFAHARHAIQAIAAGHWPLNAVPVAVIALQLSGHFDKEVTGHVLAHHGVDRDAAAAVVRAAVDDEPTDYTMALSFNRVAVFRAVQVRARALLAAAIPRLRL